MNVVLNPVPYPCKGKLCQMTLKHNYLTLRPSGVYSKDAEKVKNRLLFSNHSVSSNYVNDVKHEVFQYKRDKYKNERS